MKIFKSIHLLIFLIASAFTVTVTQAQHGGGPPMSEEKREEIESMKVAFLTKKLELTPEEAQKFWPVYNQFQGELDKIRDEQRKVRMERGGKASREREESWILLSFVYCFYMICNPIE